MTLTIIGAGYVGLVTAAVFSELGNKVFCVDTNNDKIEGLKIGNMPFFEPSLAEYVKRNQEAKRLFFTTSYKESVPHSEIVVICVGTPPKENGEADLTHLFSAVEEAAKNIASYTLITIKSTIPIGFEDDLEEVVKKHTAKEFEFASAPEFLREGTAIEDSLHPDRIVIGAKSDRARQILIDLHKPIDGERIICDIRSAQMIKYAANSFLATKISFANAIATLCEKMGADVEKVLEGVGVDKRIGRSFLYPGVGYGGSCFPKDVLAFIALAKHFDYDFDLLREVDAINNGQIESFVTKVLKALGKKPGDDLNGVNLAILGLAFKPNTDDMREAPSVNIIKELLKKGATITAYDPVAMDNAKAVLPSSVMYARDSYKAVEGASAVLVLTEWNEFQQLDLVRIAQGMSKRVLFDGRNIYEPIPVKKLGFMYYGVGRM